MAFAEVEGDADARQLALVLLQFVGKKDAGKSDIVSIGGAVFTGRRSSIRDIIFREIHTPAVWVPIQ